MLSRNIVKLLLFLLPINVQIETNILLPQNIIQNK